MRFSNSNVQFPPLDCNGCVIGQRTESDRTADGNRSGGERNPIGRRTETDRVADGIRLGGGRNLIEKTLSNRNNIAAGHAVMSNGYTLLYIVPSRGCTCLKCTNRARGNSTPLCWCT